MENGHDSPPHAVAGLGHDAEALRALVLLQHIEGWQARVEREGQSTVGSAADWRHQVEQQRASLLLLQTKLLAILPPPRRQMYESLRSRGDGRVISLVLEGRCGGCLHRLSPEQSRALLSVPALSTCPHCHRFVYGEALAAQAGIDRLLEVLEAEEQRALEPAYGLRPDAA